MSDEFSTPVTSSTPASNATAATTPFRAPSRLVTVIGAAALLLVGAGAGAGALSLTHKERATFDTSLATTPITKLTESDQVEIQGTVAEIFGNKFVVADSGGRALVETGKAGEDGTLVKAGESVTVQGRFDNGFLKAGAIQRADGSIEELRPVPPRPPHERFAPPRPDAG